MLWCLCLVAAAPIDVPSGIRRVLSSANAAAALGLDDQVQGDRHRIRAAHRAAMLAVHPDKHCSNPSLSVCVAAHEAAVKVRDARDELLSTGSASSLPDPPLVLDPWAARSAGSAVICLVYLMALLVLCVRSRASLPQAARNKRKHHQRYGKVRRGVQDDKSPTRGGTLAPSRTRCRPLRQPSDAYGTGTRTRSARFLRYWTVIVNAREAVVKARASLRRAQESARIAATLLDLQIRSGYKAFNASSTKLRKFLLLLATIVLVFGQTQLASSGPTGTAPNMTDVAMQQEAENAAIQLYHDTLRAAARLGPDGLENMSATVSMVYNSTFALLDNSSLQLGLAAHSHTAQLSSLAVTTAHNTYDRRSTAARAANMNASKLAARATAAAADHRAAMFVLADANTLLAEAKRLNATFALVGVSSCHSIYADSPCCTPHALPLFYGGGKGTGPYSGTVGKPSGKAKQALKAQGVKNLQRFAGFGFTQQNDPGASSSSNTAGAPSVNDLPTTTAAAAAAAIEAEATRDAAAEAAAEADAFAQAEAVLAQEAAEEATRLNQLVALADAAIAGAESVELPTMGYVPASHESQTVGRLGVLSWNAIARKDDINRYNLYVSVSIPRRTATGVHFSAKSVQETIRCADATPAEQQVAANTEARRLVWKLLRPALPRDIKQRKRKPESEPSERKTRPKAASMAQQHTPASRNRPPGPGRPVSRVASGASCGLGYGTPSKVSARYSPLERGEYITAASVHNRSS